MALGLTAPMLLSPGGWGQPPRFNNAGLIAAIVGSLVVPMFMFVAYARDTDGPLGWRRGWKVLWRYPVATCLALLLVPLGVVVTELVLIFVTSWMGMFRFLNLDLYPGTEYFAAQYHIPKYINYTGTEFPDSRFFHLYFRRLHQGFTLTATTIASLSRRPFLLASPWTLDLWDSNYMMYRAWYGQVASFVLIGFLALQSRWLGAIASLESKPSR